MDANGLGKSKDPNQTAAKEQSDLGLLSLLRLLCSNIQNFYGYFFNKTPNPKVYENLVKFGFCWQFEVHPAL